jgi:hypothetical protein
MEKIMKKIIEFFGGNDHDLPKDQMKDVYPCDKIDCKNYILYKLRLPKSKFFVTIEYPNILFNCLFCIHFKRQDMYYNGRNIGA